MKYGFPKIINSIASLSLLILCSVEVAASGLPQLADIPDSVLMKPPLGATPLLAAVIRQDNDTIEKLLSSGSDPNQGTERGYFPLCSAILGLRGERGDLPAKRMAILRLLIAKGASNTVACYQRDTPLSFAFHLDARNAIRFMHDAGIRVAVPNNSDVYRHGLWRAITENDLDLLTLLLNAGVHPDFTGGKNVPPVLLQAVEYLRADLVRALLDTGADIGAALYLHAAVKQRVANTDVLRMLLDAGANPNQTDAEGYPPLVWAAYYDLAPLARMLLEAGARPDVHSRSGNVLLGQLSNWTQKASAIEIVDALIKAGADPHYLPKAPREGQKTPFVSAVVRGDLALLERYLTLNVDLDRLYLSEDYLRCMKARAKPRATGQFVIIPQFQQPVFDGCEAEQIPALLRAIKWDKPELFAWLLEHGADPHILIGGKVSLLEYSARRWIGEPFVDMLIAAGVPVDTVTYSARPISEDGWLRAAIWHPPEGMAHELPILTAAALGGHLSMVDKLIAAGADPNKRAAGGATPMHCLTAAEPGGMVKYHKAAQALLSAGADLSLFDNDGYTPVTRVLSANDIRMIELVLAQDFDVNSPDGSGRLPLAVAIEFNGQKDVVHTLLRKGARVGPQELALVQKTNFPSLIALVESAAAETGE